MEVICSGFPRRRCAGIEPYFPLSHGMPRVDDRRVISGIVFVIRNGLRWTDAPEGVRSAQDDLQPLRALEPGWGWFNRIFRGAGGSGAATRAG